MWSQEESGDEAVWKALADANRRRLLDLLRQGPQTTGALAAEFAGKIGRFAVMKHLEVLCAADLVVPEKRGRERWNYLNPVPIQRIHRRWIRSFEEERADDLLRLKSRAEQKKEN